MTNLDAAIADLALALDSTGYAALYPHIVGDREQLRAYAYALSDIPVGLLTEALGRLARTEDGMPTRVRIRRECATVAGLLSPPLDEAWRQVLELARWTRDYQPGHDTPRPAVHPLAADTLALVGGVAAVLGDQQATVRAQFRDLYAARSTRADRRAVEPGGALAALPGAVPRRLVPAAPRQIGGGK